ncbi:MAG TPA: hypothetical protein VGA87_00075, partial [Pyrinomonadaceae bacterium]
MTPRTRQTSRRAPHAHALAAFLFASLCCFSAAQQRADAASLEDYRARAQKAAEALERLHRTFDETGDVNSAEFIALEKRTFQEVRSVLPADEKVEGAGVVFDVDNRWLHDELDLYARIAAGEIVARDEL